MHMKATDEKPTYVAIIISSPLTLFNSAPYPKPKTTAKADAMARAVMNPAAPVNPISMVKTAPRRPAIMPRGRPKLSPHPAWTMGIMARTMIAFMPKRTKVSLRDVSILTLTDGAAMKRARRKRAMMTRGHPILAMKLLTRLIAKPPSFPRLP